MSLFQKLALISELQSKTEYVPISLQTNLDQSHINENPNKFETLPDILLFSGSGILWVL